MTPDEPLPASAAASAEFHRVLDFAAASAVPSAGFGHLDDHGRVLPDLPVATWISARMTYSFALGALCGREGDAALVDHGLAALGHGGVLHDDAHGGWYAAVSATGEVVDDTKAAYAHAFVVLAATAALAARRPGARELLHEALSVFEERFWDEAAGLVRESFCADWSEQEAYRGANANMHAVEAFLAAADALDADAGSGAGSGGSVTAAGAGALWRSRAARLVERFVHDVARSAHWRLPEHFTSDGTPLPDYNTDDRAHAFRPYGVTPGHLLEWSRLALHLRAGLQLAGPDQPAPPWLLDDARALYARAVADGWARDGADGFVYTVDAEGTPVIRARMHWVVAEAIGAAAALHRATGEAAYARDLERWWTFATDHLIDVAGGSWWHELDPQLRPAHATWEGKPDAYHVVQATLVPRLPLAPMFATALAQSPPAEGRQG